MELVDKKNYSIISPEVRKLDRQRNSLNRLMATEWSINTFDNNDGVYSLALAQEAKGKIAHLKKELKGIRSLELQDFDRLIVQDISDNATKLQAYLSFMYDPKTPFRIGSLLSTLYGPGTFKRFQDMARPKNWPHKKALAQGKMLHPLSAYSFNIEDVLENEHDPVYRKLREDLIKELEGAKNEVENFYIKNGIIKDLNGLKFHYSPTCWDFSYWENSRMNHVHIDPHKVISFRQDDSSEPVIRSSMIKPIAVHEVGHALNEVLSTRTMPAGLTGGSERYIPFIYGVTSEGCALNTENLWIAQARESGQLQGLDSQLVEHLMGMYLNRKVFSIVYNLLKRHEDELDSKPKTPVHFNKRAQFRMADLTGIRAHMFTNTFYDKTIQETLYGMTYILGQEQIDRINKRAKKEKYTPQQVTLGLMKGSWSSLPAQEKFLFDIYLPHLRKKGICQ